MIFYLEDAKVLELSVKDHLLIERIPCICYIGQNIRFEFPLLEEKGYVLEKDYKFEDLENFLNVRVGGNYASIDHSLISLKHLDKNMYEIIEWQAFNTIEGWTPVIENGQLCEYPIWYTDEDKQKHIEFMAWKKKINET